MTDAKTQRWLGPDRADLVREPATFDLDRAALAPVRDALHLEIVP